MDGDNQQGIENRKAACDWLVGMGGQTRPAPHELAIDGEPAQRFVARAGLARDILRTGPRRSRRLAVSKSGAR
jgi:hypothetical protein